MPSTNRKFPDELCKGQAAGRWPVKLALTEKDGLLYVPHLTVISRHRIDKAGN
jgi:hypothetical protein